MTPHEATAWLTAALAAWATNAAELRDLDAAVGDGDLGVTITRGVAAVHQAFARLDDASTVADLCRAAGMAFAKGSPSTMSALIGAGLLAAARALPADAEYNHATAVAVLHAASETIAERGHSAVGDKTVLDALVPSLAVLTSAEHLPGRQTLDKMTAAAETAVAQTASLIARRGRAAWLQDRTAGHPDPGATAYARLLRAMSQCWPY